jgi:hypothetical protein
MRVNLEFQTVLTTAENPGHRWVPITALDFDLRIETATDAAVPMMYLKPNSNSSMLPRRPRARIDWAQACTALALMLMQLQLSMLAYMDSTSDVTSHASRTQPWNAHGQHYEVCST